MTAPPTVAADARLREVGGAVFERSTTVPSTFLEERADDVSRACRDMAARFHRGGRLLAFGAGPARSDALHVSVEFVHPVLVGKRALPALALEEPFARRVELVGSSDDIAIGIAAGDGGEESAAGIAAARERGLLTLALAGREDVALAETDADHRFVVPDDDPLVVQETLETLYHVLWELVHVFFDHEELL
ncbi:MAG: SIS domain-containing protein [Gemmatimonadota bacterium]|nr:SIS domain-containing protein [Gemmatimonadota bacterium]